MTFKHSAASRKQVGFSLVEILIVIAVIGVISGIAVSTIANVTGRSRDSTVERHAQLVASMAANALHAGDEQLIQAGTKEAALELLSSGVNGEGTFKNVVFRLGLTEDEKNDILPHLNYSDGLLVINPTP